MYQTASAYQLIKSKLNKTIIKYHVIIANRSHIKKNRTRKKSTFYLELIIQFEFFKFNQQR